MQLLLVEDDPVTCEVLGLMLADEGWHVTSADSGEAALHCLQVAAELPNIILCDQKLPGLQGTGLAESLRNVYLKAGQPAPALLAMSASRGPVPEGYDALLLKPFSGAAVRLALQNRVLEEPGNALWTDDRSEEEETSLPILDAEVVRNLRNSMGDDRLRELYAFALADATSRIERMESAVALKDLSALAREAHMLKGAAGMVGARRLAALAQRFEMPDLAHSETGSPSAAKMAMLSAALDDIERMLKTQFLAQA